MASFRYQALNQEQQIATGDIQAETVLQAITELEARGLTVQSIGQLPEGVTGDSSGSVASELEIPAKPTSEPIEVDLAQAALYPRIKKILDGDKAFLPALRLYAEELPSQARQRRMRSLIRTIEAGDVTEATKTFPEHAEEWIPLLAAVETSQEPGSFLLEFVDRSRRQYVTPKDWWKALAYPTFVAGVAAVVIFVLMFFVLPTFDGIFNAFDAPLPTTTRVLVSLPKLLSGGWAIVIAVALLAMVIFLRRAPRAIPNFVNSKLDRLFPMRPARALLIGKLAQFTATLLDAGFSIPDALRVAALGIDRRNVRSATSNLASTYNAPLVPQNQAPLQRLTASFEHAIRADMDLSSRVQLLKQIGQCHVECAKSRQLWSGGVVGPIAICVIGLFVAWTVFALFLPMISLIDVLT